MSNVSEFLNSEACDATIGAMRERLFAAIEQSGFDDGNARETLYRMIRMLPTFKLALIAIANKEHFDMLQVAKEAAKAAEKQETAAT